MSQVQTEESPPSNGAIKNELQPTTSNTVDPASNNPAQPAPRSTMETFLGVAKSLIVRVLIIYFVISFFKRPQAPINQTVGDTQVAAKPARNLYQDGLTFTLHVYLSEKEDFDDFNPNKLFWYKDGLMYGDWTSGPNKDGSYLIEKDIPVTDNMRNNGSLYIHAFVTKKGESPNPKAENYGKVYVTSVSKQLNRYKKLKNSGTKNLLTGTSEKEEVEDGKIVSHWHENLTLNFVVDQTQWVQGGVPVPLNQFIKFTNDGKYYKPVLYANDFWNMARDYKILNDTNETLKLRVHFQPLTLFKWQLYAAQNMKQMWNIWGDNPTESDEDQDTFKETLLDTNPYLLGITICVSILHSVFELLAFKNDIQFWNNRNSLEGLSVRSVFFSVFQSLIVLLYVLDNDTNTLIKLSCFAGLLIELWKIYKVVDIKFENGWITFKDKGSYVESSTKVYDNLAFKYLSWLCFPLLIGYSIYALLYMEHKGWYSFVLDLLYGYLLTFGFIMMTPQLFINYKLKSVAHLPWRMLTYKFLNTFIDDMFAFVIKMPTMYRIGCFRDDIVFIVFLYQRWIYPVDKARRNEFGYSETDAQQQQQQAIENTNDATNSKKDN